MEKKVLSIIEKLINEHGSSTILKERLELINDKYEALEAKLANSEKENKLLRKEVESLKKQIETQKVESIFIEYKGAKFKKMPSGKFEEAVYCLKCNGGTFALESDFPFVCGSCGSTASFNGGQLKTVLNELRQEYA
jgi:wobble nucleotide-excising tRNase